MTFPLGRHLPSAGESLTSDQIFDRFLAYVSEKGLSLYEAQEQAILEIFDGHNVILNTPTGSGKSLVALALHFRAMAQRKISVYTSPIKALVNEKFFSLCAEFGPELVGMSTGDASVNLGAPVLCCTAEVLSNMSLRSGSRLPLHDVVMDEFHYYSDRDRGMAWQAPLLTLPHVRFLLMSATLGETGFFEEKIKELTSVETVTIRSTQRPVPLEYVYSEMTVERTVEDLIAEKKYPIYLVHFSQNEAAQSAQNLLSLNVCTREEKEAISKLIENFRFSSPYGKDLKKFMRNGLGVHHAGLLPKYRILVEQLAQKGLLKVICGTDTLGVGVNVPIRTVLFTRLSKYDGQKTGILTVRDFQQISGRAGRKGFDDIGYVVVQAPEHVIENLKLEKKAGEGGKKSPKKKAPEGFVAWNKETFGRLIHSSPEALVSRFQVNHGVLLNLLGREGDGCAAVREIIKKSHEPASRKKEHFRKAWELFRSLLDRNIVQLTGEKSGQKVRLNVDLQEDFALNHALSLYLLDTLKLLDKESPSYALDLLTLVESILENPEIILIRQLDKVKDVAMAEMKAKGMDYDSRMAELELLEYPKPNREFVYSTFNAFAALHPWVGQENIKPKSIARELFENFFSFADYINRYGLHRAEGLLLRHLSNVFKVLSQTVPEEFKTEQVREMIDFLAALLRAVDNSLLEEWERLKNPEFVAPEQVVARKLSFVDLTTDRQSFQRMVRTEVFLFMRSILSRDFEGALELLADKTRETGEPWKTSEFEMLLKNYQAEHGSFLLTPEARNIRFSMFTEAVAAIRLFQVVVDQQGHNDWGFDFEINLEASRQVNEPALKLRRFGPTGSPA
ncbi:MAG: Helicase [Verrucomicrobiales bacterium]|nr:Helicase [Verrucomicrobiales bacterium]